MTFPPIRLAASGVNWIKRTYVTSAMMEKSSAWENGTRLWLFFFLSFFFLYISLSSPLSPALCTAKPLLTRREYIPCSSPYFCPPRRVSYLISTRPGCTRGAKDGSRKKIDDGTRQKTHQLTKSRAEAKRGDGGTRAGLLFTPPPRWVRGSEMPRRGLRDLDEHPPPRNFQPHQPLNHCPHLQPPHQSQLEPSREPRRGARDDFSVLGWVLSVATVSRFLVLFMVYVASLRV